MYIFFALFLTGIFALHAHITIPGSLTKEYEAKASQQLHGTIPIQNDGDEIAHVHIFLADYMFHAQGETLFPDPGTVPRSNASWIQPGNIHIEVAPHSTYTFSYTVNVPETIDLDGTYWSIFLIEPTEALTPDLQDKQKALGIQTVIRYGVQIITHMESSGSLALKILNKQLLKEQDEYIFLLSVENKGTKMQSPKLLVELTNMEGHKIAKFDSQKQRIFPTCSVTYRIPLVKVAKGHYRALAILDQTDAPLFGAQYDIDIP